MSKYQKVYFKVLIVGDGGVGKTSLLHRFIFGKFLQMKMTVGTDIRVFAKIYDGKIKLELQLWDFAGEERFRMFLPSYCRGAKACLLCYDITRAFSFKNLAEWYKIVIDNADNPILFLVGCKSDIGRTFRAVKSKTAKTFQNEYNIHKFFETSNKSGYNNKQIFNSLFDSLYNFYLTVREV